MNFVLVERPVPEVAVVTLNRPERTDAMAFDVMVPFRDELVALSHDPKTPIAELLFGTGGSTTAEGESAETPEDPASEAPDDQDAPGG